MHTGDLAMMDDEGYVNIVGRIKDMIIRGGENIYPREIEEFLYTHPEDRRRAGDRRARRRVRRGGLRLDRAARGRRRSTAEEMREFCRGQIARYKIPRYIRFVDALPDDRHRQDPEVQDARDRDRRARPRRGCAHRDGVSMPAEVVDVTGDLVARYLQKLAQIGAHGETGVWRNAYSPEWRGAQDLVARWYAEAGLERRGTRRQRLGEARRGRRGAE